MKTKTSLWDYFPVISCTNVEWFQETARAEKEIKPVCTFHFQINNWKFETTYHEQYLDREPELIVPYKETLDDTRQLKNRHIIAQAIQEVRWFQHDRGHFNYYEALKYDLSPETIQIYKSTQNLRDSFPLLHQLLTQEWGTVGGAGFIYLLADHNGHYKIGKTKNLTKRIHQLGTQPPFRITTIATQKCINPEEDEKQYHLRYNQFRMNGEWFALPEESLNDIAGQMRFQDAEIDSLIESYKTFELDTFRQYASEMEYLKWAEFNTRDRVFEEYLKWHGTPNEVITKIFLPFEHQRKQDIRSAHLAFLEQHSLAQPYASCY